LLSHGKKWWVMAFTALPLLVFAERGLTWATGMRRLECRKDQFFPNRGQAKPGSAEHETAQDKILIALDTNIAAGTSRTTYGRNKFR
jgi:hypothetical protein